jgi:hypothetical protein
MGYTNQAKNAEQGDRSVAYTLTEDEEMRNFPARSGPDNWLLFAASVAFVGCASRTTYLGQRHGAQAHPTTAALTLACGPPSPAYAGEGTLLIEEGRFL